MPRPRDKSLIATRYLLLWGLYQRLLPSTIMSSFSPSGQTTLYTALTNKTNTHSDAHALSLSRPIKKRPELSSDSETDASPRKKLRLDSKICSGSEDEELVNGFIRSYTMDFPRRRRQIRASILHASLVERLTSCQRPPQS